MLSDAVNTNKTNLWRNISSAQHTRRTERRKSVGLPVAGEDGRIYLRQILEFEVKGAGLR